jgi:ABC-type dipeptide/oligopeptide/nickel transport system permease component
LDALRSIVSFDKKSFARYTDGISVKTYHSILFAVWGVITLVFLILQLSGDPACCWRLRGDRQDIALIRSQFGFDRPVIIQYADYL